MRDGFEMDGVAAPSMRARVSQVADSRVVASVINVQAGETPCGAGGLALTGHATFPASALRWASWLSAHPSVTAIRQARSVPQIITGIVQDLSATLGRW